MKLEVVIDIASGTAQIVGGNAACAAGLEVLVHGRRMVVTNTTACSDVRCIMPFPPTNMAFSHSQQPSLRIIPLSVRDLAEARRSVRAPIWNQPPPAPAPGLSGTLDSVEAPGLGSSLAPTLPMSFPAKPPQYETRKYDSLMSPPRSPLSPDPYVGSKHADSSTAHGRIVHQAINVLLDDDDE